MIPIIRYRHTYLIVSGIMAMLGVVSLALWQLKLGIDYTGGSLMEVVYTQTRPAADSFKTPFSTLGISEYEAKSTGERGMIFRFKTLDEETHQKVLGELKKSDAGLIEKSFESIGPVIGEELKAKSLLALLIATLAIMAYITYAFRRISYPVSSWKYGVTAIIALFHDLIFVLGIFAVLGKFGNVEITSSFIPAFLTVLGFSVHDTIVIFDRIRENILKYRGAFDEIVNKSLNETLMRSINTSVTVLLVLFALYFFGGETLKTFTLTLLLGISIGTYSSIFVASPALVWWHSFSEMRRAKAS